MGREGMLLFASIIATSEIAGSRGGAATQAVEAPTLAVGECPQGARHTVV